MSIMTGRPAAHHIHQAGTCPPWCTSLPHLGPGEICMSETHTVPTASPDHFCGYTSGPYAEGPACDATVDVRLSAYEDETWISLAHGDDYMPPLTVDAAEQLARHVLELVAAARKG